MNFKEAFEKTRIAGSIAAGALNEVAKIVRPGITTEQIDRLCYEYINDNEAYSAPLFYRGFPKSCCTSSNHVVCHGIPSDKILKEGDIVNVDVTAYKNGWHGDTSRMFEIGAVSVKAKKLIKTTYESMMKAIKVLKEDVQLGDIGSIIQDHVEAQGFSVVQDFCGHGVGKKFHENPSIVHYYDPHYNSTNFVSGMIFTIEPMINIGKYNSKVLSDGWTAVTRDKTLSAQYEHTIYINDDKAEILTESPKGVFYT